MGFIESYKHLEKLCGDMLSDKHGVSAYIDEMISKPRGSYLVTGWDDDLKRLKHYRWVRNQIVHEPDCSEETMCNPEDSDWLDDFYDRIMGQTDPLALYHKATRPKPVVKSAPSYRDVQPSYTHPVPQPQPKKSSVKSVWRIAVLIVAALAVLLFVLKDYIN